ncbi:MAG: PIG-L family deacetylase, partial [Candidatus Tectomicrobia bacterium]
MPHDAFAPGPPHPARVWAPTAADSLALALRGLPVAARALMVGIHPDDEDSALLAEFALRHGVRTVYLSLTRGEGGQNRIGPETGAALGVLRTGELLAARRHDGAEQLLGPCIDFGYAKRAEDAFAHWGREHVVATVVQAIREVRPDVVISIWTGTTADGHGHHQACGIATHAAFELASDAAAFPEQLQAGLALWQPRRLLVRVRDASRWAEGDVHIDVGRWDPLLGRSCFEVAMQGRSLHRCQNMGALRPKGAQHVTYRVVAGVPVAGREGGTNPLANLPLRLDAWVQALPGRDRERVLEATETATRLLEEAWDTFHPQRPDATAPLLLNALGTLRLAVQRLNRPEQGAPQEPAPDLGALRNRLQAQIQRVESAWTQACGIALDVLAPQPQVVAGETFEIEAELFIRGAVATTLLSLQAHLQPGWQAELCEGPECPMHLPAGSTVTARFRVTVPEDEETAVSTTLLPWLRLPSHGDLYRFPGPLPSLASCAPPLLTIEAMVQSDDLQIPIVAPVMYREADPGFGEVRQPVRVVPAVTVDVAPSLIVRPTSTTDAPVATVML